MAPKSKDGRNTLIITRSRVIIRQGVPSIANIAITASMEVVYWQQSTKAAAKWKE